MRQRNKRRNQAGVTLIEMLVVVTIIAMFAGLAAYRLWPHVDTARITRARADISTLMGALEMYRLKQGTFPATEQGLAAVRPFLKAEVPLDPWGRAYEYKYPGSQGEDPEIICYGADGRAGGEGINADIVSWKSQ
ncbi:MAG: type II secretion system protein GspG [Acidobacteria bacterium]|nr:type II secretion system protein GspG [Acidobacteriota bacterium]